MTEQSIFQRQKAQFTRWLFSGFRAWLSIGVFIAFTVLYVVYADVFAVETIAQSYVLPLVMSFLLSGSTKPTDENFHDKLYYTWVVIRFATLTSVTIIAFVTAVLVRYPELTESSLPTIFLMFAFVFLFFSFFSEVGNVVQIRDNPEYKQMCKERFQADRKTGKGLFYFLWMANARKLLMVFAFSIGYLMLIRLVYLLAVLFGFASYP
ncbi:MAG: hypothetical protein M0R76_11635 [Proteobacteria bacterium]|nr:hypothetical protein [Pseudomonadota bacterium]